MQVSVVRRVGSRSAGELGALALLGFGAGIAAGFLLSEGFGAGGPRRMGRLFARRRRKRPGTTAATRAALLASVRDAWSADAGLAGSPIEARLRGAGIELAGWVPSRSARVLAYRLARQAAGATPEISNHLLVRGEDDRAGAREEAPRSA